jgi:hypothetical protein
VKCAAERLSNFEIRVGNTRPTDANITNSLCAAYPGAAPPGPTRYPCTSPIKGRYVTVQLLGKGYLTVCELQAEVAAIGKQFSWQ